LFSEPKVGPGLIEFLKSLGSATIDRKSNCINLPDGVFWLGEKELGSRLFIRHCYSLIDDEIEALLMDKKRKHKMLLKGNPGAGKSHWLLYKLVLLIQQKKRVVFELRKISTIFFIDGATGKFEVSDSRASFKDVLGDEAAYYLFDPHETQRIEAELVQAVTIVAASPNLDHYRAFSKDNCCTFFVPVWDWDELKQVRSTCYATKAEVKTADESRSVPVEIARQRFLWWGGNIRFVLQARVGARESETNAILEPLETKIKNADLDAILGSEGELDTLNNASHSLLHYDVPPEGPFLASNKKHVRHVRFASQFVGDAIFDRFHRDKMETLESFIRKAAGQPWLAACRGQFWERYLHHRRPGGISAVRRRLLPADSNDEEEDDGVDDKETTFELPKATAKAVVNSAALASSSFRSPTEPLYLRPDASNFETLDAISVAPAAGGAATVIGHQDTVSDSHGLKVKGMQAVLSALKCKPERLEVVFWVPMDVYEKPGKWTQEQKWVTSDKRPSEHQRPGQLVQIQQFVASVAWQFGKPAGSSSSSSPSGLDLGDDSDSGEENSEKVPVRLDWLAGSADLCVLCVLVPCTEVVS
jgi:hypothetical protein